MEQDSENQFGTANDQQQKQVPLLKQTQQDKEPLQDFQPRLYQPQNPKQYFSVQSQPYLVGSPPGQQDLTNSTQQQMLCNQSRFSVLISCPYCYKQGATKLDPKPGAGTWCCCLILFLTICCICWVPFSSGKFQDIIHSCPYCGQIVGMCRYRVCG